jgi:hypothetical protein
MPLTPVGLTAALVPSLLASGIIGTAMPQLALGVANGVTLAIQAAVVESVDVGTLGVGETVLPFLVPPPLILSSMFAGFAAQQLVGTAAPSMIAGLSTGLGIGFPQGLITITHAGVGTGAGVARVIISGSAVPFMLTGFASAGMSGQGAIKQASAIGIALDIIFGAYTIPVPIVGAPSILPGAGAGIGKIV